MGKTKAELGLCAVRGCRGEAVIALEGLKPPKQGIYVVKIKGGYTGDGIQVCERKGHGGDWIKIVKAQGGFRD